MRPFIALLLPFTLVLTAAAQQAPGSDASSAAVASTQQEAQPQSDELGKAEAAIVKKDWGTAEPILAAWLKDHPDDVRALFDAGYAADAQGHNDEAIANYQKAVAADPKNFESQVSLGLLLARIGRSSEARPILETATTLEPGDAGPTTKAKAWRAMAQIDMTGTEGKPNSAQASIDLLEALRLSPETPADTLMAAKIADLNNEPTAAEAAYRRVLKDDPTSAEATAGLVHQLIVQKKYPEAETLLQSALKASPDNPSLTAQMAAVYVAQDKVEALPLLQHFHEKNPQDASITRMLAQVEADAGQFAESDQLYVTLLAANPKDADLLAGHGQNLIRLKKYPEALQAFESATTIDETNGEAWNGLAFAAFQTHQPSITIHALTARSKYLPETPTIYFLWATAYDTLHDKKQAVVYYRRFLESSAGKFPDQEFESRQRLKLLEKAPS